MTLASPESVKEELQSPRRWVASRDLLGRCSCGPFAGITYYSSKLNSASLPKLCEDVVQPRSSARAFSRHSPPTQPSSEPQLFHFFPDTARQAPRTYGMGDSLVQL